MKKFMKYFLMSLIVLTALMMPVQYMVAQVGDIRLFSGEESLLEQMTPIAVDPDSPLYQAFQSKERVNVLLLGVNAGMTDTIMLGSYDMKKQHVDVISIPRDTYYPRKNAKSPAAKKINAIYHNKKENGGGAVGTATAVSDILQGMPIHYYVVVDYDGVKNIVDAIGGVKMDIPFHMKYKDPTDKPPLYVDIPEGKQTITRSNVVQLLRFRKSNYKGYQSYPEGDIGRIKMQQEFIKQAFKQSLGFQLPAVVSSVLENVDSDLKLRIAKDIALKATGLTADSIETYMLPGYSKTMNGASYWRVEEDKISEEVLMKIYGSDKEDGAEEEPEKELGFFQKLWLIIAGGGKNVAENESDSKKT